MVAVHAKRRLGWTVALIALVIVAVLMAAVIGALVALRSTAQPAVAAPASVIGWEPGVTRGAPLAAPISVYFNRAMDHASVEDAWRLSPHVEGSFQWSDTSVTFRPSAPLAAGSYYRLHIGKQALDDRRRHLRTPFSVAFTTGDALKLQGETPAAGTGEVSVTSPIALTFNHPMVALSGLGSPPANPPGWHVSIKPRTPGRGTWLGTSTWVFHPTTGLLPSSAYTVTVSGAAQDAWGLPLGQPVSWIFSTIHPAVVGELPPRGSTAADPSAPISVTFNQPMDAATTAQALSLNDGSSSVPGSTSWDGNTLQFQPAMALNPNRTYTAMVRARAASATGSARLDAPVSWTFRVAPPPRVVSSVPSNGATAAQSYVQIRFSAPMNAGSLDRALTVTPALSGMSTYGSGATYSIDGDFQPSTAYTVSLAPGAQDRYGRTTQNGYTLRFTTAPLPPAVTLYGAAGVGSGVTLSAGRVGQAPVQLMNVPSVHYTLVRTSLAAAPLQSQYGTNLSIPAGTTVRSWTATVPHPLNRAQNLRIPLANPDGSALAPGLYWLGAQGPGNGNQAPSSSEMIAVTNAGVTMKVSHHRTLVWVTSAETGHPVSGERVRLVDDRGKTIASGATDAQGLHIFRVTQAYNVQAALASGAAFGMAMSSWLPAAQNQSFPYAQPYKSGPAGRYIYTDRPIYRPGQTVHFRAVLWRDRGGVYSSLRSPHVTASATDGSGHSVYRRSLTLDRFGTVHGSFSLPRGAGTGYGNIAIAPPHDRSGTAYLSYAIASYRKPEVLTSVTSSSASYVQGQAITATVKVAYVFGAPAAGQQVDWTAFSQNRAALPRGWERYQFVDAGALERWYASRPFPLEGTFGTEIAHGSGATDGSGRLSIRVPVDLAGDPMDQTVTIEATSTDINHQPVSGRLQVAALKADEQIGIAPRDEVVASGSAETVDVAAVNQDGAPIPNARLMATVFRRSYTSELGGNGTSGSLWRQVPHDTQVSSQTVTTGSGGTASFSFTPDVGGEYYVVVTGKDAQGNLARSGDFVYASGAGYTDLGVSEDTALPLQPDRQSYNVGQTARVLVSAPVAGTTALVTTERSGILSYSVERLGSGAAMVRVPITVADIPNIYVTVTLYKGAVGASPPVWRYGVTELHVRAAPRKLVIHLSQDRTRYMPGQRVTYTVTTSESSGKPVSAEVSLSLVDTAVLALQSDTNPGILSGLYGEQPLGVTTTSDGAVSIDGLRQSATSRVQPAGAGGGGGGGLAPATMYKRFRDTGYWRANLVTGKSGRATVHITLPDNFTTWRLQARGVTVGYRVGQATLRTISTRDIVLRPVTPRFFLQGDTLSVGAIVNNDTSSPARVHVSLHGSGISIGTGRRTVTIPGRGELLVRWRAAVPLSRLATLRYTAAPVKGVETPYTVQIRVPVHAPLTEEVAATAGQVFSSTRQEVIVPPDAQSRPGDLTIRFSSSLTAGLKSAYSAFASSRYESNDDVAARLLAATYLLGTMGSGAGPRAEGRAIATLERRQLADGGWPWFSGTNATSDPLVSADVVWALGASGAARTSALRAARAYLMSQLGNVSPDQRAALLLAIAVSGRPDRSAAEDLFRDAPTLSRLSPGGLADLARALAVSDDTAAARSLVARLDAAAVVSATGANWEAAGLGGGSAVDETARALYALLVVVPHDPLVPAAARWLMLTRTGSAWDTTRDSALAVSALAAYARHAHEARASYTYRVAVDGRTVLHQKVTPRSSAADTIRRPLTMLRAGGSSFTVARAQRTGSVGGGPLYYVAQLHYFLRAGTIRPLAQGISVQRRYLSFAGHAVTSVRAGTVLQVELTVRTGQRLTHLALDDPLPSGFEPIDQSLDTSRQGLFKVWQPVALSPSVRYLSPYLTHVDLRDDRISLYANSLPPGTYRYTYLVQATAAGRYRVAPAHASETFFPEVFGRSAGQVVTVR